VPLAATALSLRPEVLLEQTLGGLLERGVVVRDGATWATTVPREI
jgi:hypothetical protein